MYKLICLLLSIVFIPACSHNSVNIKAVEKNIFFVQAISKNVLLDEFIKDISIDINTIIKQELGLDENYDFDFFIPKKTQRVTLYYLNDAIIKDVRQIISALNDLDIANNISESRLSLDIRFFGDQQDELVGIIDDANKEIASLHHTIKEKMHQLNSIYYKKHHYDLYNIKKSERFDFLPHMGLGRIRSQSIKNHIRDTGQTAAVFEKIKTRIIFLTKEKLQTKVTDYSFILVWEKVGLLDAKTQSYIKNE